MPTDTIVKTKRKKVYVTSKMSSRLLKQIDAEAQTHRYKNVFYDDIINAFIAAWNRGEVPRAYIGASDPVDKTLYLGRGTTEDLRALATFDGVSISWVVRTAFAWHLSLDCDGPDPWCADLRAPTQRPCPLPSAIPTDIANRLTPDFVPEKVGRTSSD